MAGKKYMSRRKFYVPVNEVARYYGPKGDLSASNIIVESEWIGDIDDGDPVTPGE